MSTWPAGLKKPAFVLGFVAVVAVLVAVVSTVLALRAPKQSPALALWISSGTYTQVRPVYDCDFDLKECRTPPGSGKPTRIQAGPDDRVLVSVPEDVAKGWLLDLVWFRETPEGVQVYHPQPQTFLKKGDPTFATWIEPKGDGWRLRSLAVEAPSRVLDPAQDNVLSRAVWIACADDCGGLRASG
ncbi:MAG: DUF2771 family protein [Segniliparus sp.]|uniref:DUF2771 family protein n=1 Tax=Segniliparus sp. TaxID=2804064 RepID=UPI003F3B31AC